MRKILTKSKQKNKERFNQILVGFVLIALMFLSVLGYSMVGNLKSEEEKVIYNGVEFTNKNGYWLTNMGNYQFIFSYSPKEVGEIEGLVNYINLYSGQPLYISSQDSDSTVEIYTNFNQIAQRIQSACINNESCEDEKLPIKTCDSNFIIISESNITSIVQNQSCVFIQGPKENLLNITDEFLFKTIGIRQ